MDNEILEILKRLETKIDDNTMDIKEMKAGGYKKTERNKQYYKTQYAGNISSSG